MTGGRRILAAAIASAAASVSLYPIFSGTLWFWAGLGSIAVVAAVSLATRLRPLPVAVCFLGRLAGLLLYLNLAFANARSLFHVLPTPGSARLLWDLAGQGFDQAAKYAPPVPELHAMVLLAAGGIGFAALLTDLIAVRLARAALGGLPLLLLFAEPFTLSVQRGFVGTTIAFCVGVAGYLALLSSEAMDRIREWDRPRASAPAGDEPNTRTLAAAGRRVGFASVALALFLPLVVPGLHVTRLFGGGQPGIGGTAGSGGGTGGGGAGAGFPDPNARLSQELKMTDPANVLVYTTDAPVPDYLQVYVLDQLTDNGWRIFSQPESLVSVDPRLPAAPGLTSATPVTAVSTSVAISSGVGADDLGALPVPYPAVTVSAPGTVRADRATLMVLDPSAALSGLRYSVTSLSESPPQQLLNQAQSPPADITGPYLKVPSSYDPLLALARSVVRQAGAKTAFQQAVALQNWLSGGTFAYSLNAPSVVNARGLEHFLSSTKRGYCQQFSFAMAVLARLLGIPSRLAYGFTSGTSLGDNEWLVTTHDAHAWPELYFQGAGWLRFEPTPSGGNGQGTATTPSYTLVTGGALAGGSSAQGAPTAGVSAPASSGNGSQAELRHKLGLEFAGLPETASGGAGPAPRGGGATSNLWEIAGLVLAALMIVVIAAPVCVRAAIRRRRWRGRLPGARRSRPGPPAGREPSDRDIAWAHAAWRELRDDLTDYSAGCRPSDSPRAVAAKTSATLALAEPARAALGRIALAEERARYAATPVDGSGLRRDSVLVRRAIATAVPRVTRWRARLAPVSVLRPALGAVAATTDLYHGGRRTTPGPASTSRLARLWSGLSSGRRHRS